MGAETEPVNQSIDSNTDLGIADWENEGGALLSAPDILASNTDILDKSGISRVGKKAQEGHKNSDSIIIPEHHMGD